MAGPKLRPQGAAPSTRLPDTPASPPNTPGNMTATAQASSPTPSVIMAKGVPALRVDNQPSGSAISAVPTPAARGSRLTGSAQPWAAARFSVCMAR